MASGSTPVTSRYKDAANVLDTHLLKKDGRYRKRSPLPPPSEKEVKEEIKRILDEFLKKQSVHLDDYEAALPTGYQKVYEEDSIETDGPSDPKNSSSFPSTRGSTSIKSATGSIHSLIDEKIDFPFADDVENELSNDDHDERSKSLPSSILSSVKLNKAEKPGSLSKSMSPSHLVTASETKYKPLPHVKQSSGNPKFSGSDIQVNKHSHGPQSSVHTSSTTSFSSIHGSKDVEEVGISRRGSVSSSDTSGSRSVVSPDRKKKSIFKRMKERLNRSLTRDQEDRSKEKSKSPEKETKRPKQRGRKGNDTKKDNILDESKTHIHGHIEQHHFENGGHTGVVRQQEIWESTDVNDIEHSQNKHKEKHTKITESVELSDTGTSEGGIISRIKRLASFKRKKKSSRIKESKSADLGRDEHKKNAYQRSMSEHPVVNETDVKYTKDGKIIHKTQIIARDIPEGNFEGAHSSIYQPNSPTGSLGLNEGADLEKMAKNKSFILDFDGDQVKRRRRLTGGQIDTELETYILKHQRTTDIEEDGHPGEDVTDDGRMLFSSTPDSVKSISDGDRDKVYTRVAERLAEIGDSYMTTSQFSDSASSSVDQRHQRAVQSSSSPQTRDAEGLNSLEREIRDTFREFGDRVNSSINISPVTATNAAHEIARHATYKTFEDTVKKTVGDGHSWNQLAAIFYLTKKSVNLAGAGGAVAIQVKDMAAQYLAEKFAGWIVDQGGWDTCLESGSDSELD